MANTLVTVDGPQGSGATASGPPQIKKWYPNGDPNEPDNPAGAGNTDSCLPTRATGPVEHKYQVNGAAPGDLAFRWIHGSVCAATNTDPRIQVVAYNEDTYVIRENPCIHWEAPFTYLLFGNRGALLIDTGATAEAAHYPLRSTVDAIVSRWCEMRRRKVSLTVVLTSAEDLSQNQGLSQFADRPDTVLMPRDLVAVKTMFGMGAAWPESRATVDLGGRVVDVIATPGTHKDGLTFYDRYNAILHTGDLFYPGRIQIANDRDYAASLERLQRWGENHPVKWVLGGHIEMMFAPGRAYPRFKNYRPFERTLQMEPELLADAAIQEKSIRGKEDVIFRTDYILLNRVGPDEKNYMTSPDMPVVPVPIWLP